MAFLARLTGRAASSGGGRIVSSGRQIMPPPTSMLQKRDIHMAAVGDPKKLFMDKSPSGRDIIKTDEILSMQQRLTMMDNNKHHVLSDIQPHTMPENLHSALESHGMSFIGGIDVTAPRAKIHNKLLETLAAQNCPSTLDHIHADFPNVGGQPNNLSSTQNEGNRDLIQGMAKLSDGTVSVRTTTHPLAPITPELITSALPKWSIQARPLDPSTKQTVQSTVDPTKSKTFNNLQDIRATKKHD